MARGLIIGSYDTITNGPWTLSALTLSPAVHRAVYVEVPGRDGDIDLSTALTDGEPRYYNRTLTATLERSDGTRATREEAIDDIINRLDGTRHTIYLPDDSGRYLSGRAHVARLYNDLAHGAVQLTVICDPWRYNRTETQITRTATATATPVNLPNRGRRTVVPSLTLTGGNVTLAQGGTSWSLTPGAFTLPGLSVPAGGVTVTISGSGVLAIKYREAIL